MHLDDEILLRRIDGELEPEPLARANGHLLACPACAARSASLEGETALLRAALEERASEAAAPVFGWRGAISLAAAGGVTAAALYAPWPAPISFLVERLCGPLSTALTFLGTTLSLAALADGLRELARLGVSTLLLGLLIAALARGARTRAAATAALLPVLALLPADADAFVLYREDEPYVLAAGQVLDDDLLVVSDGARIDGELRGDLILFAREVSIGGRVVGDVLGAARRLRIDGTVEGDVRVCGERIELQGSVTDLSAAASVIAVQQGAQIRGSLAAGAAVVTVHGAVGRNMLAGASVIDLGAPVGGDALLAGRQLEIGDAARIAGFTRYYGAGEVDVAPGAQLARSLEQVPVEWERARPPGERALWFVLRWGAAVAFGFAWLLVAPSALALVVEQADRVGASLLTGVVALVATPLVATVLAITLIGLPIGILTLAAYLGALYAAQIFVSHWIAQQTFGDPAGTAEATLRLALGLLGLHVLAQIPYAGAAVRMVVLLWGLGAGALALGHSVTGRYRDV
jgi:cytoskeletal protein CcmA (bactofilin family)